MLAQDEGEAERQLLVVGQAQEEGGRAVEVGRGLWVLDVLDNAVVAGFALGGIAGGREGVWADTEEGAVATIDDVEGCDRDCLYSAWLEPGRGGWG